MWRARGFDVYVPALFPHDAPYSYAQQDEAYRYFSNHVGFDPQPILTLLTTLRAQHRKLIVIGYSTGATLAWRVAGSGLCDGVICHYGSRIRQYSDELPHCPALMIMARHEPSFDPTALQQKLETLPWCNVICTMHSTAFVTQTAPDTLRGRRAMLSLMPSHLLTRFADSRHPAFIASGEPV